ncbi:MAG TPA: hypothetical protein VF163_20965, partial [Micromonosporaceae bacterium]
MQTVQAIMYSLQAHARLYPLLRSHFQAELLTWLFLHPGQEYSVAELAQRFDVTRTRAKREVDHLLRSALILERRHGGLRLLRANPSTLIARPLAELLSVTYGPVAVLSEALR